MIRLSSTQVARQCIYKQARIGRSHCHLAGTELCLKEWNGTSLNKRIAISREYHLTHCSYFERKNSLSSHTSSDSGECNALTTWQFSALQKAPLLVALLEQDQLDSPACRTDTDPASGGNKVTIQPGKAEVVRCSGCESANRQRCFLKFRCHLHKPSCNASAHFHLTNVMLGLCCDAF